MHTSSGIVFSGGVQSFTCLRIQDVLYCLSKMYSINFFQSFSALHSPRHLAWMPITNDTCSKIPSTCLWRDELFEGSAGLQSSTPTTTIEPFLVRAYQYATTPGARRCRLTGSISSSSPRRARARLSDQAPPPARFYTPWVWQHISISLREPWYLRDRLLNLPSTTRYWAE